MNFLASGAVGNKEPTRTEHHKEKRRGKHVGYGIVEATTCACAVVAGRGRAGCHGHNESRLHVIFSILELKLGWRSCSICLDTRTRSFMEISRIMNSIRIDTIDTQARCGT